MEVVPAVVGFKPEDVAKKAAAFWSVNGLSLQLVDAVAHEDENACPFSLGVITNVGMTADGQVYQLGYIKTWLSDHDTSPLTNLQLAHRRILRLSTVRDIMLYFLSECQEKRQSQWAWQEQKAQAYCQADDTGDELIDKLKELDAYVTTCKKGLSEWQKHVDAMEVAADALRAKLRERSSAFLKGACKTYLARAQVAVWAQVGVFTRGIPPFFLVVFCSRQACVFRTPGGDGRHGA